jgi:hypothetical protein
VGAPTLAETGLILTSKMGKTIQTSRILVLERILEYWTMVLGLEEGACLQKSSLDCSRAFWNY